MKQVPLVTGIMSGRGKKDYKAVLKAVLEAVPEVAVKRAEVDFEQALWRAVWGHAQQCGLKKAFNEDSGMNKIIM